MQTKKRTLLFIIAALVTTNIVLSPTIESAASPLLCEQPLFWDVIPQEPISYLYAPGSSGSEIAMVRYCPQFTASTGEKISATCAGNVIGYPHTAVCFPEIYLQKPTGFSLNPITTLVNGLRHALFPVVRYCFNKKYGLTVIDNPHSPLTVANYLPGFSSNMAQERDIYTLAQQYEKHMEQYPDMDIIFYGDSRGATSMFNFIALHQPKNVKAAVLEGVFDSISHVIKHVFYNNKSPHAEKILHKLFELTTTRYVKTGITARECAEFINDTIPLLFVTSLKDKHVLSQCPLSLYKQLKKRGHTKIHLLVLKNAPHLSYMFDNKDDQQLYETTVHAFYKHYGLPHNAEKAALGLASFLASQPTAEELSARYPLTACNLCI